MIEDALNVLSVPGMAATCLLAALAILVVAFVSEIMKGGF
jgi:hypothetical protein